MIKKQQTKLEYFYITFTDGTTVEVPVDISAGKEMNHDALLLQLRNKQGSVTAYDGQVYQFRDVVRYEVDANKRG